HNFAFDPGSQRLAVTRSSKRSTIEIFDLDTGKVRTTLPPDGAGILSWHPGGQFLATTTENDVDVWDVRTGKLQAELRGHEGYVSYLAFNHAGDVLATAGWSETLRLWDPMTGRPLVSKEGGGGQPQFSPDDR